MPTEALPVSEMTRRYWIHTLLSWASVRLAPPQFDECKRALFQTPPQMDETQFEKYQSEVMKGIMEPEE